MKEGFAALALVQLLALVVIVDAASGDPIDWPTLGFAPVVTNTFYHPIGITHAGDGSQRLFVVQQQGMIWIIQNSNVLAQPFLNIANRVFSTGPEQGLLGLAFPPGFPAVNHFYVDYTIASNNSVVISRFRLTATNGNVADTNSEQRILVIPKPYNNHNAGQLAFGPDGYLYIGIGDGGSEGDPLNYGQNTRALFGKLLRIDVESGISPYAIPTNNPFVGNTNYAPETWAYGLRNPWRFSFDRSTGDLYVGDVGQNLYEEIDYQASGSTGGQNYGWRIMEGDSNYIVPPGFTNFSALTLPVAVYNHSLFLGPDGGPGAAVIGGYVYRGPDVPRMNGIYFYGDFESGWIWGLTQNGGNWTNFALMSPPNTGQIPTNFYISTFGDDDPGNLYMADYYAGKIYSVSDTHQVWTPSFSPAGGIINSNTVVVSCATTNAVIHYTTNGAAPTTNSPVIASGASLPVTSGITYKMDAFRPDLTPSGVAAAVYTLQAGTPVFSPPAGPITSNTLVSISDVTPGAAVYYTTDGATPTTNSLLYAGPLTLSGPVTVRAMGVAAGFNNSIVASAVYPAAQAATPLFVPPSGPITNDTAISISCTTPGSVIYYTLDGSLPTTSSTAYSNAFTINGGVTVNAFAVAGGYINSAVQSVFYSLVQTATPVFSPASGPVAYGTDISITCATPGSTIFYTLDGTTPSTNSATYSGSLIITNDVTVAAYAVTPGHLDSAVQTAGYTLLQAAAPAFNPAQGPLTNGTLISISSASTNAIIHYTLDGSDPGTNAAIYSSPLLFTNQMTLTARAYRGDLDPSTTQSAFYGLVDFDQSVVTTIAGAPTAGFSNAIGTLAQFSDPQGICIDHAGNLYVADTGNNVIRKILPSGQVTTFAGTGVAGSQLGPATNAQFGGPTGVCLDGDGNLYVADGGNCNRICKIDTNGMVTLLANVRACYYLPGLGQLVADSTGNLYVGSWATVEMVTPVGAVIQLAGSGLSCYYGWCGHVGPSIDSVTNIYAATEFKVWKIAADGTVELFAGSGGGYSDGLATNSLFEGPQDTAVDAVTNVFVTDLTSIRRIGPDGWVSTLAGGSVSGYVNGPGSIARFNGAAGVCMDTNGNVYVADSGNNAIRKISPGPTGPPSLNITVAASQVVLSWPIWAGNFTLETSSSLSPGNAWTPLTNGVVAAVNNFVLTNNMGPSASFYRLRQQ